MTTHKRRMTVSMQSQNKSKSKAYLIAMRALLVAAAMVLSWLEAQIPAFFAVPGIKLGLTNLVVLVALYKVSEIDAFVINLVRIFLVAVTFGSMVSLWYSIAGGILSYIVMLILKKTNKFSTMVVSIFGGIFHNVGQIAVAILVLGSKYVLYYLPVLWASGIAAGAVVGIICGLIIKKLPDRLFKNTNN